MTETAPTRAPPSSVRSRRARSSRGWHEAEAEELHGSGRDRRRIQHAGDPMGSSTLDSGDDRIQG